MHCDDAREAASARMDAEPTAVLPGLLDEHLSACADCRSWVGAAGRLTGRVRPTPAPDVPDLTRAVLAALPARPPVAARGRGTALRVGLVLTGLVQAVSALSGLLGGPGAAAVPVHLTHEGGAWNLAVAVGLLAVAAVPWLAAGALPFLGTLTAVLTVVALADLGGGHVGPDREVGHLLLLVGLVLTAALAWQGRRPGAVPPGAVPPGTRVLA